MDELLNKYGLPNDNGFIINGSMFRKFFDNDEDYIYNNDMSDDQLLKQYEQESQYYKEHKEEEDNNFLNEWNSFKKK